MIRLAERGLALGLAGAGGNLIAQDAWVLGCLLYFAAAIVLSASDWLHNPREQAAQKGGAG